MNYNNSRSALHIIELHIIIIVVSAWNIINPTQNDNI